MSIMYCEKHDEHFDSDFVEECKYCEEEVAEEIPQFKGTREQLSNLKI